MVTHKVQSKWVQSAGDERAVRNGCTFDERAGVHVVDFFRRYLRHSKDPWAGKPFELFPEQRDKIIMPLFGWKRADGTRRFRIGYISVAKKNFKSTMNAGLSLYMLTADGEKGAGVYCAAADRAQASIVFDEAANMVDASPTLKARITINRSVKRMYVRETNSIYQALSKEVATKEGYNISFLSFDELHAQKNRDLWDSLRYSGATRRQPLIVAITTAGYDRESICYEQYQRAKLITDPNSDFWDDSFFVYIAEVGEKEDWTDRDNWRKANPGLGVTVSMQEMEEVFAEAEQSATQENTFRRYRLNQWTEQAVRWLPMDKWDAGSVDPPHDLKGRKCWGGLDLASTQDVAAFVLVFPDDSGAYDVLCWFWIPEENARKRERRDGVPYITWAREEWIEPTEGNVTDYDVIRERIKELGETYDIAEIAIDRWNSTQLQTQLDGDGFVIVPFGQGFKSMTAPSKELEKLVLDGKIRHGGNPVLRWMASNVAVEMDAAGNLKPSKKRSTEKIDGIVSLIMALGRAIVRPKEEEGAYAGRDLIVL